MNSKENLLLVIGYVWPEPASSAAGKHMLSLIRLFLKRGWKVHYASPAAQGEHEIDLLSEGAEAHQITLNCSSFDSFVERLQPTAVLFDRYMMEEQFSWRVAKVCPDALRILDMEDVHSLREARQKAIKAGKCITEAEVHTDLAKREAAAIFRSDVSLVISEAEMAFLQEKYQIPIDLLEHCPFLHEAHEEPLLGFAERAHFISIGNFRHAPNWDAVRRLKEEIWPQIRKALPEAELHVYGAYPPPKATQLHDPKTGFLVQGWASDARQVMGSSRVCLAPLRFGAGLKGKLTEAMLCGTPSVTTRVGAEGIQGGLAWPGAVEDEVELFIKEAISLYQDQKKWEAMHVRGESILEERFDRESISERVMKKVEWLLQNLPTHREKNFIGGMLLHQSMRSTQYMSQWIEEKNRR